MSSTIEVHLWRGRESGRYERFEVPAQANQTILDVVTFIQRNLDPTVSYRFACRVGVCGSCAMTVNGRPRWTCRTHVSKVVEAGKVEIAYKVAPIGARGPGGAGSGSGSGSGSGKAH